MHEKPGMADRPLRMATQPVPLPEAATRQFPRAALSTRTKGKKFTQSELEKNSPHFSRAKSQAPVHDSSQEQPVNKEQRHEKFALQKMPQRLNFQKW